MSEAEAYADEDNARPSGDQPTYQWGDEEYEEYATRTACEDAIAAALASYLCDADAGMVTHGINAYLIKINVTLIE